MTSPAPGPIVLAAPPAMAVPLGLPTSIGVGAAAPALPLREARALAHAHPSSPRALDAWARAALRAGELREAHRAASAWALHDGTVEPRLVMADVLDASGRRGEATALLAEWLESHPDAADARASLERLSNEPIARR
jgi:hypothetical protein